MLSLAGTAAAAEIPDLTGRWEMDPALSEDPIEKMRLEGGGQGPGRGGPRARFGDGFRQGPGRGGGPGRPSPEEMRPRFEELRRGLERLEIAQTGSGVTMTYADGRVHEIATDNKWRQVEIGPRGGLEVKARWRDGALVLRKKGPRGGATETYYVTSDKKLLTVLVEMETPGPQGSVAFKRIYRPSAPAPGG